MVRKSWGIRSDGSTPVLDVSKEEWHRFSDARVGPCGARGSGRKGSEDTMDEKYATGDVSMADGIPYPPKSTGRRISSLVKSL